MSWPVLLNLMMMMTGPSQQFGWAGHGHYAPLNIPNIFKAAGINTRWIPGQDPVFQVGLLYPSPPSQYSPPPAPAAPAAPAYSGAVKVKKSIPKTQYSEYKQSGRVEPPAVPPPYSGPPPSPSTPALTTTSTTTTTRPTTTTTTRTLRYSPAAFYRQSPTPPSYQYSAGIE